MTRGSQQKYWKAKFRTPACGGGGGVRNYYFIGGNQALTYNISHKFETLLLFPYYYISGNCKRKQKSSTLYF